MLGALLVGGVLGQGAGFGVVGHAQVGAQHVDAHLPQLLGGGVVGEVGQGVHPGQAHRGVFTAEFFAGAFEAFGEQAGVLPLLRLFGKALAPVGDDQGRHRAQAGDHGEGTGGDRVQVLRGEPLGHLQAGRAQQQPDHRDHPGHHRGGRTPGSEDQPAQPDRALLPPPGLPRPHDHHGQHRACQQSPGREGIRQQTGGERHQRPGHPGERSRRPRDHGPGGPVPEGDGLPAFFGSGPRSSGPVGQPLRGGLHRCGRKGTMSGGRTAHARHAGPVRHESGRGRLRG